MTPPDAPTGAQPSGIFMTFPMLAKPAEPGRFPQLVSCDRSLSYAHLIFWAAVVGLIGGSVATAYYYLMQASAHWVWQTVPEFLARQWPGKFSAAGFLLAATTLGGLLVGLTLRCLGAPGEIASVVQDIHDPGRIDIRQTPSMVVASLISITAGGSAGPEAPLVQVNASFGSWLGDRLKLSGDSVRRLTFCGMSAALGAFFGAPLGGALFALEIPHRRGLEYYEALIPAIVAATLSFAVFRSSTGLTIGGLYHFPAAPELSMLTVLEGAGLGLLGALVAVLFIVMFRSIGRLTDRVERSRIALATVGGLLIGLIALAVPQTLFFGEQQIETMIATGSQLGVRFLLLIALAKMLAISCTLHSGFRGGFIFPLFFIGATVGLAVSLMLPLIHPTVGMLCLMAAVNVAVTKTPISTTVILTVISDTSMVPVILVASFVSFLATTSISLIPTQRSRLPLAVLPLELKSSVVEAA